MNPAEKPLEADDPFEPTLVGVPSPEGYDGLAAMGRAFVEEFAAMGWQPQLILRLFQDPFYQGPYLVYSDRGEAFVSDLIDAVFKTRTGGR